LGGGIKYKKSTDGNQSILQRNPPLETSQLSKNVFSPIPKVQDEESACLKNGGFFKTSQLNDGGFAYT
jgi:hypothetical protein